MTTWRSPQQGHAAPREIVIEDTDHRTIALARGIFILLDCAANHAVSPADRLPDYPVIDEKVFEDDFQVLPEVASPDKTTRIRVRRDDLDINRHVNNSRYITFAMESAPRALVRGYAPDRFDIIYRHSAEYGDTIMGLTRKDTDKEQPTLVQQLVRENSEMEYARLVSRWQKIG